MTETAETQTRVLATGTFDLLHPGHLHYLSESRELGDELHVIVARESMIDHKEPPVVPGRQRRDMVEALDPVDTAVLGSEDSIFDPLEDLDPDVITLGYDQYYSEEELEEELEDRGFEIEVVRVGKREERDYEILSTTSIIDAVIDERC
ncbi:adenylyltransferase/cytidyltransferase family protein [Halorutilales archaeon Cl-col2-1]